MIAMQPAGDFDYERGGTAYAVRRRTDPRIAARVHAALGNARTVLNVGAGAGSYEPTGSTAVTAVEPSAAMRAQRPADRPAIDATKPSNYRSRTPASTPRWPWSPCISGRTWIAGWPSCAG